jgi:hypothetical protein
MCVADHLSIIEVGGALSLLVDARCVEIDPEVGKAQLLGRSWRNEAERAE